MSGCARRTPHPPPPARPPRRLSTPLSPPSALSHALRSIAASVAVALAVTLGSAVAAPAPAQATSAATTSPAPIETIHTTSNHPWLTADRGWVEAGQLRPGEPVVTLSGATETVAWVHVVAGQADYYNLTVAADHTYAVGAGHAVVHNDCEDLIGTAEEAANNAQRPSATSMRVEDAECNPVALPEM